MSGEDINGAVETAADTSAIVETPVVVDPAPAAEAKAPRDTMADVWEKLNPPRDNGKFAPKSPEQVETVAVQSEAEPTVPASPAPAGEAPKAPISWPKEQAELWSKLDPAARDYILKREGEVEKGFQSSAEKYKPYEEMDRLFEPHKARLAAEGVSSVQLVQRLLNAQAVMDRDPIAGLNWLARSYGVDLGKFATQQTGQEGQPQPAAVDPRVETMQQRLARLENEQYERAQREAADLQTSLESEVAKFRASPEHPHFDAVRSEMAQLMASGVAKDLEDAYQRAVWSSPDVRSLVIEAQRKAEADKAAQAAQKAKQSASLNVRSTPAAAVTLKTTRDTMAEAYDRAMSR